MRLTVYLVLAFLVVLTSCGGSHQKQLTLAVVSGVEGEALKQAASDYEKQTGIHIDIAEFPYTNLFEKELIDLKAHTGAYDLIMLDDPWFPRFAHEQVLTDLTPLLKKRGQSGPDSDFVSTSLALCRHPYQTGSLYALPYVGNSQLFFYRKDLFEKYLMKAPATWDDVLAAAKTIQEKETAGANGGQVYGYVERAAQGNAAVADFMPIFWAFGAEMFDARGKPTVNSPQGIAALEFMIELGKYSPPGYVSFNADDVGAHLLQGTAAMSINWPAWISSFSDGDRKYGVHNLARWSEIRSGRNRNLAHRYSARVAQRRSSCRLFALGHECRTNETLSTAWQPTNAQITLSGSRAGCKVSRVSGSIAFARKLETSSTNSLLERN